jgi:hypothetical protein
MTGLGKIRVVDLERTLYGIICIKDSSVRGNGRGLEMTCGGWIAEAVSKASRASGTKDRSSGEVKLQLAVDRQGKICDLETGGNWGMRGYVTEVLEVAGDRDSLSQ